MSPLGEREAALKAKGFLADPMKRMQSRRPVPRGGRTGTRRQFHRDDAAISEVVGALLLVVVVSSAAFGFGLFLHAQAKATEAQKAAELEKELEKVAVQAIAPVDAFDATCAAGSDGTWDSVSVTLVSLHLHDTRIQTLRLNGIPVTHAWVGPTEYDFTVAGTEIPIKAREQLTLQLRNVDSHPSGGSCPLPDAYSLGGNQATQAIATSDSLVVDVMTALTNSFSRVFVPPTALGALEATPGVAGAYTFVGTGSTAGAAGAFLVRWDWDYWTSATWPAACGGAGGLGPMHGHRVQVSGLAGNYCARLTVTDNYGLSSSTDVKFAA